MMFLQYAMYGIWMPLAGKFLGAGVEEGGLGFDLQERMMILALAGGIGAICAPFVAGQIADRYFATERCLAVLLILGGIVKYVTAYQTSFAAWLSLSILYAILFVPTQALTNSLAMAHLADPKRQFPGVRVFGTLGWITVSWLFPMIWLQTGLSFQWLPPFFQGTEVPHVAVRMIDSLKFAGMISVGYGLYCWFCLPHTPPKRDAVEKVAFAKAFGLARRRSFAVLIVTALLISVLHTTYMAETSKFLPTVGLSATHIQPAMSISQFAEIAVLSALGLMLSRLGFRLVLSVGCFCFCLRYAVFGIGFLLAQSSSPLGRLPLLDSLSPCALVVSSLALHGFCFSCFIAASFIYVDRIAPPDVRHSAQTTFMLIFFGVGPLLTGVIGGPLQRMCASADGSLNYATFWFVMAGVGVAATLLIAALFRDETETAETAQPAR
jgi:MFS family permease